MYGSFKENNKIINLQSHSKNDENEGSKNEGIVLHTSMEWCTMVGEVVVLLYLWKRRRG